MSPEYSWWSGPSGGPWSEVRMDGAVNSWIDLGLKIIEDWLPVPGFILRYSRTLHELNVTTQNFLMGELRMWILGLPWGTLHFIFWVTTVWVKMSFDNNSNGPICPLSLLGSSGIIEPEQALWLLSLFEFDRDWVSKFGFRFKEDPSH